MGKGEIARYEQFLLFPRCFQKACFPGASKDVIVWEWVNPIPKIKILRAVQLNCLPKDNILDWSKMKALADDNIDVIKQLKFVLRQVENILGNGKIAC